MSAKKRARSVDPNAAGAISAFAKSDEVQVTYHARTTKVATPRPTGIVRRRNRFEGVARSLASIGDSGRSGGNMNPSRPARESPGKYEYVRRSESTSENGAEVIV